MKTSLRMFVRREGKRGHDEVLVSIDWAGCSENDISHMAGLYVLHRLERQLKQEDNTLPESYEVLAKDYTAVPEPEVPKRSIPKAWKEPPHTAAYHKFTKLVEGLTPEEIAILLDS